MWNVKKKGTRNGCPVMLRLLNVDGGACFNQFGFDGFSIFLADSFFNGAGCLINNGFPLFCSIKP
jgi:hypothetical protein